MNEITKIVKSKDFEITFRQNEEEWYARVENFGGYKNIEFSFEFDTFASDKNWEILPDFLDYLNINLKNYVQKSINPLIDFAKISGFFDEEEAKHLNFDFNLCVSILNNSFSIINDWSFELDFIASSNKEIDTYGRWFVSFSGQNICGIRREYW